MSDLLYKNYHVSLYKTKNGFVYAQRRNINSTASLCFKKEKNNYFFLIRYQPLPIVAKNVSFTKNFYGLFACPITGSLENKQMPLDNAIQEIYEEANFYVSKKNLIDKCFNVATTQMNEIIYHFLFDISDCKKIKKQQGDGSFFEKISCNKWVSYNQIKKILNNNKNQLYLSSLLACFNLFEKHYGKIKN